MERAKELSEKLMEHLKKHCLNYEEEVLPFDSIETSDYFCSKYTVFDVTFEDRIYCFLLRNQQNNYTNSFTNIGGYNKWLFFENSELFVKDKFVDTRKMVENYIVKYNMIDSEALYNRIDFFPKTNDFIKAVYINFISNPLDKYAFLSYLHLVEYGQIGSKIDFLMNYRLLKAKREINNSDLFEKYLLRIPFSKYETEEFRLMTFKILDLPKNHKLRLHGKMWRQFIKDNKKGKKA